MKAWLKDTVFDGPAFTGTLLGTRQSLRQKSVSVHETSPIALHVLYAMVPFKNCSELWEIHSPAVPRACVLPLERHSNTCSNSGLTNSGLLF